MNFDYIKKSFAAEWLKIKGLGLLYVGIISAAIAPLLILIVNFFIEDSRNYDGILKSVAQRSIEDNLSVFGGFFLLITIIIAATRIAQTDHKNNGWTFLETQPLNKFSIYTGKFLVLLVLSTISIAFFIIFCIVFSSISQLIFPQENLNFAFNFGWIVHTFTRLLVMSLGIISLQMMLSIVIRGFIWPFLIGFVGFVINIVGKIRQETYDFVPYNNTDTSLSYNDSSQLNGIFNYSEYLSIFWMILFFLIGYFIYSNRGFKNAFLKNTRKIMLTILGVAVFSGLYFWITKPIFAKKLEGKTVVEGNLNTKKDIQFVTLISTDLQEPIAKIPVKDGKFRWESTAEIPFAEYILDVEKKYIPLILSKGDHLILDISKDDKHFEFSQKGTRKAEAEFGDQNDKFSMFYDVTVKEKSLTNDPEKFYEKALKEWEENKNFLNKFRTKENIHLSADFYEYKKQYFAIKMLNAIDDYRRMTSFSDKKFAPPSSFQKELQEVMKKPTNLLLSSEDFAQWKLKNLLPENGIKNADSLILVKLSALPKSKEKDQLLKTQLLKLLDLERNEDKRNALFQENANQFSNPKYVGFVANELRVINNQQKGKPFPMLMLEDESGKKMNLSQFKGKFVVLDLWATWCAPCKETSPVFEYQAKNYRHQDNLVFVAASIDEDKNKWKLDIRNKKSAVTQWWIANPEVLKTLGVNGIPRFMMIDPQGRMYSANLPRPNETNFEDILDKVAETRNFNIDF